MTVEVTPRAIEVLKRAFELGRMDPAHIAIRISVARGPRGEETRTGFAEQPEEGEVVVEAGGIRVLVPLALSERGAVVDVTDEHDTIVVR